MNSETTVKRPVNGGRRPFRRDSLVAHVRGLIVSGQLGAGERVPTHKQLERQFKAESPTVRAAMRQLVDEGFVETRHRRGSYVSAHPPHLSQIGFAYFTPVENSDRYQFLQAIQAEAERWRNPARRILPFYNLGLHAEVQDYQRLQHLLATDQLAGLVFTSNPYLLRAIRSPLVTAADLPRVVVESAEDVGGFPAVYPDLDNFLPKAFARLAARGCRRVAVVKLTNEKLRPSLERIPALAAEHGLRVPTHCIQAVSTITGEWASQLAHLLLHGPADERPDGLAITDDNLVPAITAGIRDSGLSVPAPEAAFRPGDLAVVAHANFPYTIPSAVPAIRLGYDIRQLVTICIERLDQQRAGQPTPAMTRLPAVFEDEFVRRVEPSRQPVNGSDCITR